MTPLFEIDRLRRDFDHSQFDCGTPSLNEWLQRFAWTNQQSDSARTYVALEGKRIAGYYALTTGSVHRHEAPRRVAKGLANHPVGVIRLARLAVDRMAQGKGLGKALLFDALSRIEEAAAIIGVRAVLVHAGGRRGAPVLSALRLRRVAGQRLLASSADEGPAPGHRGVIPLLHPCG